MLVLNFHPIGGPEEAVNDIDFVLTEKDTLTGLISSINGSWIILNPNKLVSFDPKKIDGLVNVQPISETIFSARQGVYPVAAKKLAP